MSRPRIGTRIGIVSYWFNRGQGTVGRYIRSSFDSLGYETLVLARPTKDNFDLSRFVDRKDVWDQEGVTCASKYEIPVREYRAWAKENSIDVAFFDQNYQFKEIKKLRDLGVKTVGRFVWERFSKEHVKPARRAFDIIYSFTRCEQERYAAFDIESPRVQFGCHPELTSIEPERSAEKIRFFYPGGYLTSRKPTKSVIEAFRNLNPPNATLIIKAQRQKDHDELIGDLESLPPNVQVIASDVPAADYYRLFSSCHVCVAPSRWEGLGLHLYEAIAFCMPLVTNDNPPMNEVVRDGYSGLLVKSHEDGRTKSGIPSFGVSVEDLTRALGALCDPAIVEEMMANTREMREFLSWEKTSEGFRELAET